MQLSMTVGAMAVVLGVVLAGGYAIGEDGSQPVAPKPAIQKKAEDREAQRRSAIEEEQQQARK